MASALALAFVVYSCSGQQGQKKPLDFSKTPIQTVRDMNIVQTEGGKLQMRVEAGLMKRYETDSLTFEKFPMGIKVYSYTDDGVLESTITAREARHDKFKRTKDEVWRAFGNVVIKNIVKSETMETDTLYWDRKAKQIYTDCYIRMYSPDGFMQGYGMRSDEKARNSIILKPFNSYGVVVQDTTEVIIDTVNFIGPLMKN